MSDLDMAQQLAAALDGHSVTDEEGEVSELETDQLESAPVEQTTDDESATGENPPETESQDANADDEADGDQLAEDDSGKKYVPLDRFNKVYGKMKSTERELAEQRARIEQGQALLDKSKSSQQKPGKQQEVKIDKADILELKMTLPQFNQDSDKYDEDLDRLGFDILRANPGMTPLEAGRVAIDRAKRLTQKYAGAIQEARTVKAQQSDNGITSRRVSTGTKSVNPDVMSLEDMESYLKETGNW